MSYLEDTDEEIIYTRPRRQRIPTEKGKEYRIQLLIKERRNLELKVNRYNENISTLISTSANNEELLRELDTLAEIVNDLNCVHESLCKEVTSSTHQLDVAAEERYIANVIQSFSETKENVRMYLRAPEEKSTWRIVSGLSTEHEESDSEEEQNRQRSIKTRKRRKSAIHQHSSRESLKNLHSANSIQGRIRSDYQSKYYHHDVTCEPRRLSHFQHEKVMHERLRHENRSQSRENLNFGRIRDRQLESRERNPSNERFARAFVSQDDYPENNNGRYEMEPCGSTMDEREMEDKQEHQRSRRQSKSYLGQEIWNTHDDKSAMSRNRIPKTSPPVSPKVIESTKISPVKTVRDPLGTESLAEMLCKLLYQQAAPTVDIEPYNGDPINYHYFMASFKEVVETNILDSRGRLTRLIQFTTGEAKELIQHCIQLPPSVGYQTARGLLKRRYGDTYKIVAAYRKEIKNWPSVKPGDTTAYRKFHNFLIKCQSVSSSLTWNVLENPDTICTLLSKLPIYMVDKWNRQVLRMRRGSYREPVFADFVSYIEEEVELVNDPLFSRHAIGKLAETKRLKPNQNIRNYATGMNKAPEDSQVKCINCCQKHGLDHCEDFLSKSLDDRNAFLTQNKLCYGCCNPMTPNHNASTCTDRCVCRICGKKHPTCLHGYKPKRRQADYENWRNYANGSQETQPTQFKDVRISTATTGTEDCISMCVVPIKIRSSNSGKVVATYAMLDNCSQGTFVTEDLLERLGVDGSSTQISMRTMTGEKVVKTTSVTRLEVSDKVESAWWKLPRCYSQKELPVTKEEIATPEKISKWKYLHKLQDDICCDSNVKVGILIGANCPKALEPLDFIPSQDNGPYAFKSRLGWCIVGPLQTKVHGSVICNKILLTHSTPESNSIKHGFAVQADIKETGIGEMLKKIHQHEFVEPQLRIRVPSFNHAEEYSWNDLKFLKVMEEEVKVVQGHYMLPLPLRNPSVILPDNKAQVLNRLLQLKKRFVKDKNFFNDYKDFMEEMVTKGYAKPAETSPPAGKAWYIPHFSVYDPNKPGKIRVVFDCSAEYKGVSLNQQLISGPDLSNQLIGVLMRFRQEQVAIIADIEKMFYQVLVPENQRSLLRFWWWPNSDMKCNPIDMEMTVHLFGAVSSPGCANFALKKSAQDSVDRISQESKKTIERNFYVDDLLKSVEDVETAVDLMKEVTSTCASRGFNLTKVISNRKEVLANVPEEKLRKNIKEFVLKDGQLPIDKALGVFWNVENDNFQFNVTLKEKPQTRRGMLSILSSIYDPCGFVSPFMLKGRKIIQNLCTDIRGWDDPVPAEITTCWKEWCITLDNLTDIKFNRCFKPKNFKNVAHCSIHHFSDASEIGYGQVSYCRLVNADGKIHCAFIMGKSRVTPKKYISMPRLELTAAVLSVKISAMIRKEVEYEINQEVFWTDSKVVLSYVKNMDKRFKIFVANRVQFILENTSPRQWFYVPTKLNPADSSSRGLAFNQTKQIQVWINGPTFLWEEPASWPNQSSVDDKITEDDLEIKKTTVFFVQTQRDSLLETLESKISSWKRMRHVMAYILRFTDNTRKVDKRYGTLNVQEIENSGQTLFKLLQNKYFGKEIQQLRKKEPVSNQILDLNPFIDADGLLRVGGRLKASNLNECLVHPVLLPKASNATKAIIAWCHVKVAHGGRDATLNELRSSGLWIPSANSAVRSYIYKCVTCRYLRGKVGEQLMSDLPKERLDPGPPFTHCGVDMFGPLIVKKGRSEHKRYGAMFTCFASRSIHIEVTQSMTTDSFLLALRRFIARRGNIRTMRSDNGTNFVGAKAEMEKAIREMDQQKIENYLKSQGADWIIWKNNPPSASHHGGVWERQIRSTRVILTALMKTHGGSLTEESLNTLMTEVESIVNSRPLTVETLSDPNSLQPISPNMLLTQKSKLVMPPPGIFSSPDIYNRKQWRRVQHLAQEFWTRWRKEFLTTLQQRGKWQNQRRNFCVGDIVLLKDETTRPHWPMGRIEKVFPDQDGNIRTVKVRKNGTSVLRPISKIVLLLESELNSPTREPLREESR